MNEAQEFPSPLREEVRALVAELGTRGGAILPVLEAVRRARGTMSDPACRNAARILGVRPADLKQLAVRIGILPLERRPAHAIAVCVHERCRRRGSLRLLETIREETGLLPGGTSAGGELSVETVRCLDACTIGPNVLIDGRCCHGVDPAALRRVLGALAAPCAGGPAARADRP